MTQSKLLWPTYDPDLNAHVDGAPLIKKYVEHCFQDANLKTDYDYIIQRKNVDDIILNELNKVPDNRPIDEQKRFDRPVMLNQK